MPLNLKHKFETNQSSFLLILENRKPSQKKTPGKIKKSQVAPYGSSFDIPNDASGIPQKRLLVGDSVLKQNTWALQHEFLSHFFNKFALNFKPKGIIFRWLNIENTLYQFGFKIKSAAQKLGIQNIMFSYYIPWEKLIVKNFNGIFNFFLCIVR